MRHLTASFRVLSFCKFNERVLLVSILKTEGFTNYSLLAKLAYEFIGKLQVVLLSKDKSISAPKESEDS